MSCEVKKYHRDNFGWKLYVELGGIPWDLTDGRTYLISAEIKGEVAEYYQRWEGAFGSPTVDGGLEIEGPNTISIRFGGHYEGGSLSYPLWEPGAYYIKVNLTYEPGPGETPPKYVLTTECFTVYLEVECEAG